MLLGLLHTRREEIPALGRQYGARRIRVFGSVARGQERPDGDVDFPVDVPQGYDLFAQRMSLADRLSEIIQRRSELVLEHELNRHLRDQALSEAIDL